MIKKNVFTTTTINGETILYIGGEIDGCITTKDNYSNDHFSTMFKWGNKKDTSILYPSYGHHGRFLEYIKNLLSMPSLGNQSRRFYFIIY